MQSTIRREISAEGVGIHYNQFARLTLKPAPEDTGVVFRRVDITDRNNEIKAIYYNVFNTSLNTQIVNSDNIAVSTIEHIMAALMALKVTNVIVEIDNIEVPIMEGGSEGFCFIIECVGLCIQKKPDTKYKLLKEINVGTDSGYITAKPSNDSSITFTSDFHSTGIGEQTFVYNTKTDFVKEISSAKTIVNIKEVAMLQKIGMGLGGSLRNTLVYSEEKILNEKCDFHKLDFVKHKILDFIGDLALAGGEIIADFRCYKSGHKLNYLLLKEMFSNQENYKII